MCTTPASNFWNTCTTPCRRPYWQREHPYPLDTVVAAFVQALAQPSAWTALPLPPRLLRLCTHCPGTLRSVARQPARRVAAAALPAALRRRRRPGSRALPLPALPQSARFTRCRLTAHPAESGRQGRKSGTREWPWNDVRGWLSRYGRCAPKALLNTNPARASAHKPLAGIDGGHADQPARGEPNRSCYWSNSGRLSRPIRSKRSGSGATPSGQRPITS